MSKFQSNSIYPSPLRSDTVPRWWYDETSPARQSYKGLLRYIVSRDMAAGAKLPTHQELGQMLGCSNDALMPAMQQLVADGVIVRRTRLGTTLAHPERMRPLPWTIGLATFSALSSGPTAFFADLAHRLQTAFMEQGWRWRTYLRVGRKELPRLSDFPHLEADIAGNVIDGLVMITKLDRADWHAVEQGGVPVYHLSIWEDAPNGIAIDQLALAERGLSELMQRRCRRLATVCPEVPSESGSRAWVGSQNAYEVAKRSMRKHEWIATVENWPERGHHVARELLARPVQQRPDGILFFDDYVAMGFCEELMWTDYQPVIVTYANRQLPLSFGLPVVRLELDIDQLVTRAMSALTPRLMNPQLPAQMQFVAPARLIVPTTSTRQAVAAGAMVAAR